MADAPTPDMYDIARFFAKVAVTPGLEDCWSWCGYVFPETGYGRFSIGNRYVSAHRFCYAVFHGPVAEDHVVRHKCDNRRCVNPTHLETGTPQDNVRDRVLRGRSARGSKNGRAKLTEEQALEILRSDDSHAAVARRYGVDPNIVAKIRRGRLWSHVTGLKPSR